MIRKGIEHDILPALDLEVIEALPLKVKLTTGNDILLAAVYFHGGSYDDKKINNSFW